METELTDTLSYPKGFLLRHTLHGHTASIYNFSLSPNGQLIATPSGDTTIRIWNIETGSCLQILRGHTDQVRSVAWSPNGSILATGSIDQTIRLWEIRTGDEICILGSELNYVNGVSWSPDGRLLASASGDRIVRIWNIAKKICEKVLEGHNEPVVSVAWSPDGKLLASGAEDKTIRLWSNGQCKTILKGHMEYVLGLGWSPDSKMLASGSGDQTVHIWDVLNGHVSGILKGHTKDITSVCYLSNANHIASKSQDGTVRIWQCDKLETVAVLKESHSGNYYSNVGFIPKTSILVTLGEKDTVVRVWEFDFDKLMGSPSVTRQIHYANAKVVLIGESSTGKTCLARALMGEPFQPQESTHGMKVWILRSEIFDLKDGKQTHRETLLWDLAGQVDYQIIHQLFLDQVALGVVLFDPTDPVNPFAGIGHWTKALVRFAGEDCPRLLVAGRIDRGHPAATSNDIEFFSQQHGYGHFIATSAKTGQGVDLLRQNILQAIPWDRLPITSSPELWDWIREYLLERRASEEVLTRIPDLREAFRQRHADIKFTEAEFDTVVRHAQAQGILYQLSFGDFVLLKPELLNDYAAAIVRVARQHPDGLGCVAELDVIEAKIDFQDLRRLSDSQNERSLLYAVVQLFLQHELALRESGQLVFPTKFNRQRPDIPKPQPREMAYRFEGPVETIYATLVVRLSNSGAFTLKNLWKNAAEFLDALDNLCGFTLDGSIEGEGFISIFFSSNTPESTKVLFIRFIDDHLNQRSLTNSVRRDRIYRCLECGEEVENRRAIEIRLNKGLTTIICQFCDKSIQLLDVLETKFSSTEFSDQIRKMKHEVAVQKGQAVGITVADAKKSIGEYDVFLAHNTADRPQVIAVAKELRHRGLNPWLAKEQIPPGCWFQDIIQQAIQIVKSAAIFIGPQGLGRWQIVELRSFISQCVDRDIPIIPVLLPGVKKIPEVLVFLKEFNWVKFENNIHEADALDNLHWGITGELPRKQEK